MAQLLENVTKIIIIIIIIDNSYKTKNIEKNVQFRAIIRLY